MEQIGRYRIIGEIGRGAMGVVYRAEDPAIGRTVAVKTIRLGELSEVSERKSMRERLLREARSAGILSHPGIVTIYDIAEQGDTTYIFMEYVDGDTLETLISSASPLPRERMIEILRQTAAALDYAHAKGIVHRDIKPANIMISVEGQVKITDFGVAKILSQQMTQTQSVLGTPYYMSPEQIRGAKIDGRADQFSLAVVSYELMTGERPYSADSLPTLLYKIVQEMPVPPQRINPTLAPEVEKVLSKAFAKDPRERFFTCTEFVNALALAAGKRPDWKPLPRGALSEMETLGTVPPPAAGAEGPPGAPEGEARPVASRPAEKPPIPSLPRLRRPELEEDLDRDSSPSLARYVFLVLLLIGLAAAGYLGYQQYLGPYLETGAWPGRPTPVLKPPPPPAVPTPASLRAAAALELQAAGGAGSAPPPPEAAPAGTGAGSTAPGEPPPPPGPRTAATQPRAAKPSSARPRPRPPAAPAAAQSYWVQIRSHPPGAQVTADGSSKIRCRTPCEIPLRAGRHVIQLAMGGRRLTPRIIQVPEVTDVAVNLDRMAGTLAIHSRPPGAAIFLNGQRRPEKTPAMIQLPVGTYRLRLTLPGRRPFTDTVTVRDQVITTIGVDW